MTPSKALVKLEETCSAVLSTVSETGDVILACRQAKIPPGDFMRWIRANSYEALLADAKAAYADRCMREMVEIADADIPVVPCEDAAEMAARQRSEQFRVKNRIDVRKFVIDKMVPNTAPSTRINITQDNRSIRMTPLSKAFEEREKG